jgi:hypothetical protein
MWSTTVWLDVIGLRGILHSVVLLGTIFYTDVPLHRLSALLLLRVMDVLILVLLARAATSQGEHLPDDKLYVINVTYSPARRRSQGLPFSLLSSAIIQGSA